MMIDWLFGSIDALKAFQAESAEATLPPKAMRAETDPEEAPGTDALVAKLIMEEGLSARAVGQCLGLSTKTVMVMAARVGVMVQRRAKTLKPEVLRSMTLSLQRGEPKAQVAAQFGVSITTVTTTLQTVPGLSAQWHRAIQERRREQARRDWLSALETLGHLGVSVMRREVSAAHAWLYRNDPSWLRLHQPAIVKREAPARRVDWDARDAALSAEVERAALALRQQIAAQPLKLWQLYQAVPELRAKLRSLEQLPLTAQVVRTALGRASQSPGFFDERP